MPRKRDKHQHDETAEHQAAHAIDDLAGDPIVEVSEVDALRNELADAEDRYKRALADFAARRHFYGRGTVGHVCVYLLVCPAWHQDISACRLDTHLRLLGSVGGRHMCVHVYEGASWHVC